MSGFETLFNQLSSSLQSPRLAVGTVQSNIIFTKPTADLALISSDGVIFRVHRIILAEASTFFETMFTLPQPAPSVTPPSDHNSAQEEYDGLPAIHVTETERVLESLLRLCYPIDDPILTEARHHGRRHTVRTQRRPIRLNLRNDLTERVGRKDG